MYANTLGNRSTVCRLIRSLFHSVGIRTCLQTSLIYIMSNIWGVTAMTHDASITVVQDGQILFAGQAERYSQIKHDPDLCSALIEEALGHGEPDVIAFYENRLLKKIRQACDWHFVQGA